MTWEIELTRNFILSSSADVKFEFGDMKNSQLLRFCKSDLRNIMIKILGNSISM